MAGLSPLSLVRRVLLPAALPSVLTGLRNGLSLAWMFMVAAELIAATQGLQATCSTDGRETGPPTSQGYARSAGAVALTIAGCSGRAPPAPRHTFDTGEEGARTAPSHQYQPPEGALRAVRFSVALYSGSALRLDGHHQGLLGMRGPFIPSS